MKKLITAHGLTFEPLIDSTEIAARVAAIGHEIQEAYQTKHPLFLCVLNGAFVFAADLLRACEIACEVSFVRLASYDGMASKGEIKTVLGVDADLKGRHIIVVEDIVDSGRTLHHFMSDLKKLEPASIALAVLLVKPDAIEFPVQIDYKGFDIANKFVVGYGLDYDGLCRNLKDVYQLYTEDE
ncbi:MAG: hypoxanthine phosphoribosyltransferase [Lewinellaceae bacterium]|nr:hypoxanthine phosphoribosyltransferase [Saprospiraceae bacterium]MCB9338513.1 hypoxanthine phosphoribosyltransferase [Lewinellaceae bacterium]